MIIGSDIDEERLVSQTRAYINHFKGYKMPYNRQEELSDIITRLNQYKSRTSKLDTLDLLIQEKLRETARQIMKQYSTVNNDIAMTAMKQA